jgi:hypothetical protein
MPKPAVVCTFVFVVEVPSTRRFTAMKPNYVTDYLPMPWKPDCASDYLFMPWKLGPDCASECLSMPWKPNCARDYLSMPWKSMML